MKREIAQAWVDALRSGEYEQGNGRLCTITHDGPQHCCLAVLCEIAIEQGIPIVKDVEQHIVTYNGHSGMPGQEVHKWSGLTRDDAENYASMNDNDGKTFAEIADTIEEQYLKGGENNNG